MLAFLSLSDDAIALLGCAFALMLSVLTLQLMHFLQQGNRSKPPPQTTRGPEADARRSPSARDGQRATHESAV